MISRKLAPPKEDSYLLVGPKDTGKSTWLKNHYKNALFIDLNDSELSLELLASPDKIWKHIPKNHTGAVVLDDIHKVPQIIPEILKKLTNSKTQFVLSCSSLRPLRKHLKGNFSKLEKQLSVLNFHPLTAFELKKEFHIDNSLRAGHLAKAYFSENSSTVLSSFVLNLLKEEVQGEGFSPNLANFSRFLIACAKSQEPYLNIEKIAEHALIDNSQAELYVEILEDLLVTRKLHDYKDSKKKEVGDGAKSKLYFFDVGIYRYLKNTSYKSRPQVEEAKSNDESNSSLDEMCTLFFQELVAYNDMFSKPFELSYWTSSDHKEVAFVMEANKRFVAFDIKDTKRLVKEDYEGVRAFKAKYPKSEVYMIANVPRNFEFDKIHVMSYGAFIKYFFEIFQKLVAKSSDQKNRSPRQQL